MLVHSFASMTTMAQQSEMQWPANALTSEWTIKQGPLIGLGPKSGARGVKVRLIIYFGEIINRHYVTVFSF